MNETITIRNMNDLIGMINEEASGFFGIGIIILLFSLLMIHLNKRFSLDESILLSSISIFPVVISLTLLNILTFEQLFIYILLISSLALFVFAGR